MSNERRYCPAGGMMVRPSVWLKPGVAVGDNHTDRLRDGRTAGGQGRPTVAVSIPPCRGACSDRSRVTTSI